MWLYFVQFDNGVLRDNGRSALAANIIAVKMCIQEFLGAQLHNIN